MAFTRIVQTISVTNTVQATFTTALNNALALIPSDKVISVDFFVSGTAPAPRYSALIKYFQYN